MSIEKFDVGNLIEDYREDYGRGQVQVKDLEWEKRLVDYRKMIERGKFPPELIPVLEKDVFRNHYDCDKGEVLKETEKYSYYTNIVPLYKLKDKLVRIKSLLAQYHDCREEDMYIGDINSELALKKFPYEVVLGNLISREEGMNFSKIKAVAGDLYIANSSLKGVKNIQVIGGNGYFYANEPFVSTINLKSLEALGGNLTLGQFKRVNISLIKYVRGGFPEGFTLDTVNNIKEPLTVNGNTKMYGFKDLGYQDEEEVKEIQVMPTRNQHGIKIKVNAIRINEY